MSKIIAFMSGNGGAGVSSLVVSLGSILSQRGNRTLLLDANAGFRTLDVMLEIADDILFDISDIVSGNCDLNDAIKVSSLSDNLFLLPAPSSSTNAISADLLNEILDKIKDDYDYIIIDIPNKFDSSFKSTFNIIDKVILVAEATIISVKSAKKVKTRLMDLGVSDIRLVINKFSKRKFLKSADFNDLDEVIDEIEARLIAIVPEDEIFFSTSVYRKPQNSDTEKILSALADRICGINHLLYYKYLK